MSERPEPIRDSALISSGGLISPPDLYFDLFAPFTVTYRVRNPLRRWWLRRHGWSTEWTVEYEPASPVAVSLPRFTATRGGVDYK